MSCVASELKPDIIALTETWCNSEIPDAALFIEGYELIPDLRMDRTNTGGGRGGGIIVYARSGISALKIDRTILYSQLCSFLVNDVTINLVYRPPSANADSVTELAETLSKAGKSEVFIGDFNLPRIDWVGGGGGRGCDAVFLEAVENTMMQQLVDFPTQVKGNILDILLTNIPERVEEVFEAGRLGKSDHVMIVSRISVGNGEREEEEPRKNWRRADWQAMRNEVSGRAWLAELRRADTAGAWDLFKEKMDYLIAKYVPSQRRRNQNKPAWLSQNILREIRKKKRVWKLVRNGAGSMENYKKVEKSVTNMIRSAKRKFEKKLASGKEGGNRQFFAYVKRKTGNRSSVGPLKNSGGETVADAQGMAEILNAAFKEVFTREDSDTVPDPEAMDSETILTHVKFTARGIKKKILELKKESAPGPDGITPQLLQELAEEIAPALVIIFTKSMDEGVVPPGWKDANVTPIFKKGSKSTPSNYRPVSLTAVVCKVMESLIRDEITEHLNVNKLLKDSQHGFMRGRSCATNLLEFLEKATTVVDGGGNFDIIYLDFAKAFDKVPRQRLIKKIRANGVRGPILRWINEWLTGRRQRVVLNGKFSSWEEVLSGVPQGSVLGPLLFLIFINDLDGSAAGCDILRKFADDTKLGKQIRTHQHNIELQEALNRLLEWSKTWGMEFNVAKCKVMYLGSKNPKFEYEMAGQKLQEVAEEKDIGVYVTDKLKPASQCRAAAKTAQAVLGQLTRA